VTLCQRAPRLLFASPSLITFQFHSLVVSLSDRNIFSCRAYPTFGTRLRTLKLYICSYNSVLIIYTHIFLMMFLNVVLISWMCGLFSGNSSQHNRIKSSVRPSKPACKRTWGRNGGIQRLWIKCTKSWKINKIYIEVFQ